MTVVECLDGTILSLCTGFLPGRATSLDTMTSVSMRLFTRLAHPYLGLGCLAEVVIASTLAGLAQRAPYLISTA